MKQYFEFYIFSCTCAYYSCLIIKKKKKQHFSLFSALTMIRHIKLWQYIRCNKKIRIKIFVLWFHGRCHIEQIDVRLLNRTQNRNDVSTWNLVQMLHRHRYTTLFSWNFKYLFLIWITVKSNMIGRFIVTIVTNSKHWRHDNVCYVTKYLCPKFDIDWLFNF